MSTTTTDMAKVTQMLDAGWQVRIYKGDMGSYEVRARHPKASVMRQVRHRLEENAAKGGNLLGMSAVEAVDEFDFDDGEFDFDDGWLMTDDFTPEQALTRMAYKVFGEVI